MAPGSVTGLKEALRAPPCQVKATTRVGQRWIAETVEAGVAALDWPRQTQRCVDPKAPLPRISKAAIDAPAANSGARLLPAEPAETPGAKKKKFWRRLMGR